jgi:hypothetical protein
MLDNTSLANHTVDGTIAAAGSKATYTGAGMTVGGWLLSSEFAVLVGIVIGVAGFFVNWFYKHRQDERERAYRRLQDERDHAEHEARMRAYEEGARSGEVFVVPMKRK